MIFLAAVGAAVEMAAGSWRFACVYFISGIIGVMFQFLVTRHTANPAPVMGAAAASPAAPVTTVSATPASASPSPPTSR